MALTLSTNDIDLWFVNIEQIQDESLLKQYQNILHNSEYKRNQRFVFEKDRKRHLITRALLRSVLSEYNKDIEPQDWRFTQNDYGKPEVIPQMNTHYLNFNLSHSQQMIVLAVTNGKEVGVDIESLNSNTPTKELAKHTFAPQEYKQLKSLNAQNFHERFFDFWTLKEAYIKACGMGLSIPLDSFSFSFSAGNSIQISFEPTRQDTPEQWQFWQTNPNPEYIVSLGIKSPEVGQKRILIREITPLESYSIMESESLTT